MSGPLDIHDLARQLAVLDEGMNTKQAQYEGAIDRLRADMAARDKWIMGFLITVLVGIVLVLARDYVPIP